MSIRNVVPEAGELSTATLPPWLSATFCTKGSPMPQPFCSPLPSRRRYSKIRPRCSIGMTLPELWTDSSMRPCVSSILMRMPAPSPYLTALVIKFSTARRSEFSHQ
jgi:hypothetical protein